MRENLFGMILVVLVVACIIVQGVNIGASSPSLPTISVNPLENTAEVGQTFQINVTVSDITQEESLYGWQFTMNFNPVLLQVDKLGTFFSTWLKDNGDPPNSTVLAKRIVNDTEGSLFMGQFFVPPLPDQGATGNGTLATVTFEVKSIGATLLEFEEPPLTELSKLAGDVAVPMDHEAVDGFFDNRVGENEPPEALFNATPLADSHTKEVIFDASASYDPDGWLVNYTWSFGDGSDIITAPDPVTYHTYTLQGNYTTTLTVADNDGATGNATAGVIVNYDVAIIDVTISHTVVMPGVPVTINATVANEGNFTSRFEVTARYFNLTADAWVSIGTLDVTNLAPYADKTLTFTWNTTDAPPGSYLISANASVLEGEIETVDNVYIDGSVIVGEVNIMVHPVVVGGLSFLVITESNSTISNFNFVQTDKKIGFNVAGENGTSGFCNVTIPKSLLDAPLDQWTVLVDGTPVILPQLIVTENATHTFIHVTYDHGIGTRTLQIIGKTVATPPMAVFSYSPEAPIVGEEVAFNSASYDSDGTITSWEWDLDADDIIDATTENTTFTYNSTGTYTVTLTVKDDKGLTNETQASLKVLSYPNAVFTYSPETVIVSEIIAFNASVSSDTDGWIVTYSWDFGDGNVTAVSNITTIITHSYAAAGTYMVTLNVTDNDGLNNTHTRSISIGKMSSTVSIDLSPNSISLGETTTISGSIDPVRSGVTVTIWHRLKGEETWSTITNSTDENGQYSYVWTPDSTGTYEIKASWEGDEKTLADETEVQELTVQEAPTPISPYLIAAAVGAIAITIILVYFVRIRKPK